MAFVKFTETYENHWLAQVIAGLAEYLAQKNLEKALEATCAMHYEYNCKRALIALALRLSRVEPSSLEDMIENAACTGRSLSTYTKEIRYSLP